jgi:rubrerythrin
MDELEKFYNDGFGWVCRLCEAEIGAADAGGPVRSRLMREGEGESKQPVLSTRALAKWSDETRSVLVCPGCGTVESIA